MQMGGPAQAPKLWGALPPGETLFSGEICLHGKCRSKYTSAKLAAQCNSPL